jgi:putative DNA primase/helicase
VRNGTLDLKTGLLRPHQHVDLLSKQCPVAFNSEATCPLFDPFLHRVMGGNVTMITYLQRLAGMYLTGDVSVQELYVFHGAGANGKSVFLDTLSGLLGDYVCEAAPSLLTTRTHDEHADLAGKRLVIGSETEEGARLRGRPGSREPEMMTTCP